MDQQPWTQLAASLGVGAPLVLILFYLLRQQTEERRDITEKFLTALTEALRTNTERAGQVTAALTDITAALREAQAHASGEHLRILEAIQGLSLKTEMRERRAGNGGTTA